jgi:hypothetical protein
MAYLTFCPMCNDSPFPDSKAAGVVKLTTQFEWMPEVKEINELYLDSPIRLLGAELNSSQV